MPRALRATYYVDFSCSHSWCGRAEIERFEREYAGTIPVDYVIYPLIKDAASFHDVKNHLTSPAQVGPHWAEVAEAFREPIDHRLWAEDPPWSSWPAAAAFYAAEAQGRDAARAYFRALRLGVIARRKNIARAEVLLELAREAGLDPERLAADMADPRRVERVRAGYESAAAKGVRTRPTLVIGDGDGREYWVIGPRPWADFEAAVAAMTAEPSRLRPGEAVRVGGRVPRYDDLDLVDQQVEGGVVRSRLRIGRPIDRGGWLDGAPGPKREQTSVMRLLRVQGDDALAAGGAPATATAARAAVLREMHPHAVPIVSAAGRRAGRPFALIGVVGLDHDPGVADAFARAGRGYLARALSAHRPGILATPASRAETDWLMALLEAGAPVAGMRHVPGPRSPGLAAWYAGADAIEGGDFCLFTIAEPVAPPELMSIYRWRADDRDSLRERLARVDEAPDARVLEGALQAAWSVRERQVERLRPTLAEGAWYVWPSLWVLSQPGGGPKSTTDAAGDPGALSRRRLAALEAAFTDAGAVFPVRSHPVAEADREHLRQHARAGVLCSEQEITRGIYRHQTLLTAPEAAAFMP